MRIQIPLSKYIRRHPTAAQTMHDEPSCLHIRAGRALAVKQPSSADGHMSPMESENPPPPHSLNKCYSIKYKKYKV